MAGPLPATLQGGGAAARLDDGRTHLQHGPIDLIVDIDAPAPIARHALAEAMHRFDPLLEDLMRWRAPLSRPLGDGEWRGGQAARGVGARVAKRMCNATRRTACAGEFVTPMAAVAGSVADEVLDAIVAVAGVRRAAVNNGGDIAVYLAPGQCYRIGVCADPRSGQCAATLVLHEPGRHGVATSGWQGRSHSFGIADAVTVWCCGPSAAARADVAATLVANAVDADAPAYIDRCPADALEDDSDLGARTVTVAVRTLPASLRRAALAAGTRRAQRSADEGGLRAAWLQLQGEGRSAVLDEPQPMGQHR